MPISKTRRRFEIKKLPKALTFEEFKAKKIEKFESDLAGYSKNEDDKKYLLKFKDIGRDGYNYYLRESWEIFEQKNMNGKKAFVIEKLRLVKRSDVSHHKGGANQGDVEYRIGYYIVTPKNRWWWGESCPFVPEGDMPKMTASLLRLSRN